MCFEYKAKSNILILNKKDKSEKLRHTGDKGN